MLRVRLLFLLALTGCSAPEVADGGGSPRDGGADSAAASQCSRHLDCGDQSAFCSRWECQPGASGADERGCIDLGPRCEPGQSCDEELDACGVPAWCTEGRDGCLAPGNCDGDGALAPECVAVGGDCDDTDGTRYPGNVEVCDAEGHDEDCDTTTLGELDADSDGFVSATCCNDDACGPDCDDSRRDVYPDATELCNAVDDDCDGVTDEPGAFCPVGTCVDRRCRAVTWERVYGGTGNDGPNAVAVDPAGNVYVTYTSLSPIDLDGDGTSEAGGSVFLLSLTPEGRHRWVVSGAGGEIAVPSDGLAVVAIEGDGSTVRWYSTVDGAPVRSLTVTPPAGWDRVRIRRAAPLGDDIILGVQLERLDPSDPWTVEDAAVLLRRIDELGTLVDERLIDLPGADTAGLAVLSASSAGVLIAGATSAPLDFGSTPLPAGAFLARLSAGFDDTWALAIPQGTQDASLSTFGEAAIVGQFRGTFVPPWGGPTWNSADTGAFAISFAPDGAHRWTRLNDGPGVDTFWAASYDGRGGLLVSGNFSGTLDARPRGDLVASGTCDAFFALWAAGDGFTLDARRFSGPGCETISGVAIDPYAGMIIGGGFDSSISILSGTSYTSRGASDGFVARVSDTP